MQYDKHYPNTAAVMFFRDASRAPWVRLHTGELHRASAEQIAIADRLTELIQTSGDDESPVELPSVETARPAANPERAGPGPDRSDSSGQPEGRASNGEQPTVP